MHSGGGEDMTIVPDEYQSPKAMSGFLCLKNLLESVQPCPDVHSIECGPFVDLIGEDYTL
jgi:hypothetical protein